VGAWNDSVRRLSQFHNNDRRAQDFMLTGSGDANADNEADPLLSLFNSFESVFAETGIQISELFAGFQVHGDRSSRDWIILLPFEDETVERFATTQQGLAISAVVVRERYSCNVRKYVSLKLFIVSKPIRDQAIGFAVGVLLIDLTKVKIKPTHGSLTLGERSPHRAINRNQCIRHARSANPLSSRKPPHAIDQPWDDKEQEQKQLYSEAARRVALRPADSSASGTYHL
jgi:hypothetical protein